MPFLYSKINIVTVLALTILVWILIYVGFNIIVYEGEFEHPDSTLYFNMTSDLVKDWKVNGIGFTKWPEYINITTSLSYVLGPNRIWPELLNLFARLGTIFLVYLIVQQATSNKKIAVFTAFIFSMDPYSNYLATQYLRDTLILFFISLSVFSANKRSVWTFLPLIALGILRPILGLVFAPLMLVFGFRNKKILFSVVTALTVLTIYSYIPDPQRVNPNDYPTETEVITTGIVPTHTEFFDDRTSKTLVTTVTDTVLFPYPWQSNNLREIGFSAHMVYLYIVFFIGSIGLIASKKYYVWPFLIIFAVLALGVSYESLGQAPLVRWRLAAILPLTIAMGIGMYQLLDYNVRKRAMDLLIVVPVFIASLPIFIILWLSTGFFIQDRVGYNGKIFRIYKFRTMIEGSDRLDIVDPVRVTRLGKVLRKTALDELPQMINIIRGDMSIVGPRPLGTWTEQTLLKSTIRNSVLPGLIGRAQIRTLRTDTQGKLEEDLLYVQEQSTVADLKYFLIGLKQCLKRTW